MALTLYVTTSGTTTQLNDGAPFRFENAEGLSGSNVVRYEQGGPSQSGVTDLGFHLQPRIITLNMLFWANTAALLDTYRATLMAAFKPLDSTSILLSASRDDGEIRTLTCFTVGDIEIALVPEEYPGHLHRATVQLRAATPLWNASAATVGTAGFSDYVNWWLAGGAISAANVKMHTEYPAQDSPQLFAGTITGDWSVAVVTAKDTSTTAGGTAIFAWSDGSGGSASFGRSAGSAYLITDSGLGGGSAAWPGTTDYNYHVVESRSGTQYWRYWTAGSITQYINTTDGTVTYDYSLRGGSFFTWRGNRLNNGRVWTPELKKAAVYGTVTVNQLQALGAYMVGTPTSTVSVVNDGDAYAYPVITMHGPASNMVIVNTTTSSTIDLTGVTVGSADVMTIDLRDGNKTIYTQGTVNLLGSATTFPVGLAGFSLAPAPIAAGGTNTITVTSGTVSSASTFAIQIVNQYMSF